LVQEFNSYIIEALIVHLLGQLFRNAEGSLIIRVAKLVENLDLIVRDFYHCMFFHLSFIVKGSQGEGRQNGVPTLE